MHRLFNESIEKLDMDELMQGRKAYVFYSDPPWNDGNLKYWSTLNYKQTGKKFSPISFEYMVNIIKNIIDKYVDGYVFLEQGKKQTEYVVEQLKPLLFNLQVQNISYGSGNNLLENRIIIGSKYPDLQFMKDVSGLRGAELPYECIKTVAMPNQIVLDPFCGMGYTAIASVRNGMVFYGNEFNQHRLNKTKRRLDL